MTSLRHLLAAPLLVACLLLGSGTTSAGVGISVNLHLGHYPELVPVPGYPVYYAPHIAANFFFFEGAYWLFEDGHWFTSHWYDGPWHYVDPFYVPAFVLRVPVRYYRAPPPWFRGWYFDAPPRWGHHWGPHWSQRRHGWDHWDRHRAPKPAPLPHYQRDYRGDRYPRDERQQELHRRHYRQTGERDQHPLRGYEQRPPQLHQERRREPHQERRPEHRRESMPQPAQSPRSAQPDWQQRARQLQERPRPEPRPQPALRHPERLQQPPTGYRREADQSRRDHAPREQHAPGRPHGGNEWRSRGERPQPHERHER